MCGLLDSWGFGATARKWPEVWLMPPCYQVDKICQEMGIAACLKETLCDLNIMEKHMFSRQPTSPPAFDRKTYEKATRPLGSDGYYFNAESALSSGNAPA